MYRYLFFANSLEFPVGIASEKCGCKSLKSMQHFMHESGSYKIPQNAENHCCDGIFIRMHKIMYKQCSILKATNADLTVLSAI